MWFVLGKSIVGRLDRSYREGKINSKWMKIPKMIFLFFWFCAHKSFVSFIFHLSVRPDCLETSWTMYQICSHSLYSICVFWTLALIWKLIPPLDLQWNFTEMYHIFSLTTPVRESTRKKNIQMFVGSFSGLRTLEAHISIEKNFWLKWIESSNSTDFFIQL